MTITMDYMMEIYHEDLKKLKDEFYPRVDVYIHELESLLAIFRYLKVADEKGLLSTPPEKDCFILEEEGFDPNAPGNYEMMTSAACYVKPVDYSLMVKSVIEYISNKKRVTDEIAQWEARDKERIKDNEENDD